MSTIRLKNRYRSNSKVGSLVRIDPLNPNAFIYVELKDLDVVGIIANSVSPGNFATINLINYPNWNNIQNLPTRSPFNPKITVSDHAPSNPSVNDIWIDTSI